MGFERIESVRAAPPRAVPDGGARWFVLLSPRRNLRTETARYYAKLILSRSLAHRLAIPAQMDCVAVALFFGTGPDAGKIAVQVDGDGDFFARKRRDGCRVVTLSAATCDGLFALTAGLRFDIPDVPVTMATGRDLLAVIALPAAALAED